MGINGLLKALSPLLIPENEVNQTSNQSNRSRSSSSSSARHNIRQFANKSIAIDASSWLFKASYSCAERLVESIEANEIDPHCEKRLCSYMIKRCDELLNHASIKRVYIVFDGKRCPLKEVTNKERETRRQGNLKEARKLSKMGKKDLAGDKYRACVKVTSWMAESVATAVKKKWGDGQGGFHFSPPKVICVFSPYEADAQLVKLCIDGLTNAIVTEDSDVLVYSAACNVSIPIIYKLSRDDGSCDVLTMDWLFSANDNDEKKDAACRYPSAQIYPSITRVLITNKNSNEKGNAKKSKTQKNGPGAAMLSHLVAMSARERRQKGAGSRMFVQACVLAGCDYAPNQLAGVGLVTAFKMIKENAHRDVGARFHFLLNSFPREKFLPMEGIGQDGDTTKGIPLQIKKNGLPQAIELYEILLAKSEAVFYYHHVKNMATDIAIPLLEHNTLLEEKNESGNDETKFWPCLNRFDNDLSFTGSAISTKQLGTNRLKRTPSIPVNNPYTINMKPLESMTSIKSKVSSPNNALLNFFHKKDGNLLTNTIRNCSKSSQRCSKKERLMDKKVSNGLDLSFLDSESDEYLDEKKENFYETSQEECKRLPVITPSIKDSHSSISSIVSSRATKSKFFTFEDKETITESDENVATYESNESLPLVTPKVGPRSSLIIEDQRDNDSNDCMIIDNPFPSNIDNSSSTTSSFLKKNSCRSSIFDRFQHDNINESSRKQKKSVSSFNKVQKEGTCGKRIQHYNLKTRKRVQNSSKPAVFLANKRSKTPSIKGFFVPLSTRKVNK
jgi:5'-3' exonuclease